MTPLKSWITTAFALTAVSISANAENSVAQTPPMGWNSFDGFYSSVTEDEMKANALYVEKLLKPYGWEYIVVDYCWSYPVPGSLRNAPQTEDFIPALTMDEYARVLPAVERFPSAANGAGFKPLADHIHSLGLKFGIHIMRGIPRQAVAWKTKIKGTNVTAADIADTSSTASWINHMYGVDMTKEGAQEYYDSLFELYASWGVDYVKVDDISYPYQDAEIEAIHKAIEKCGRPMVLSLSLGPTPLEKAEHVKKYAHMWRMSGDFWDRWPALLKMFDYCEEWAPHVGPGNWPDADMLPLGRLTVRSRPGLGPERWSNFTLEEQYTVMTLWSIFRSPLMLGGDVTQIDSVTLSLLNNREVLAVNQNSTNNRLLFRDGSEIAWVAEDPNTGDTYLAVFNVGEKRTRVSVDLNELCGEGKVAIRDLWLKEDIGVHEGLFSPMVFPHGASLFRLSPVGK